MGVWYSIKKCWKTVKDSYIYKLVHRLLSWLFTILLIFLLVIGAMMFVFNIKSKQAEEKGIAYTPPFGLYTIVSGSMEPKIHVYDVVVAVDVKDLSKIKVGDVITFVSTWELNYGTTVTHTVIEVSKSESGEYQFLTKGDANQNPDGAVVTSKNLIGKVALRIPMLGRLQFFLATKIGWFIVVFIPAVIIIILDLIKIFKLKVLKLNIDEIKNTKEADKTYFENERLDSRELDDSKLITTSTIQVITEEKKELKEVERPRRRLIVRSAMNRPTTNIEHKPLKPRNKK